jgi:SAM-dependent methyltransferase
MRPQDKDFLRECLEIYYMNPGYAFYRALEARLLAKLDYQESIGDLGCCDGSFSAILFAGQTQRILLGLDIDAEAVKKAKSINPFARVVVGDIQRMGVASETFNTLISNCVIEHVQETRPALQEIGRILRPGGRLFLTSPSEKYGEYLYFSKLFRRARLPSMAKKYENRINRRLSHWHCYSAAEWKDKLSEAGLELVSACYYSSMRSHACHDLLANSFGVGIGRVGLMSLYYRIPKFFEWLGTDIYKKLSVRVFWRLLKPFYDRDEKESKGGGGGLFIVAVKR